MRTIVLDTQFEFSLTRIGKTTKGVKAFNFNYTAFIMKLFFSYYFANFNNVMKNYFVVSTLIFKLYRIIESELTAEFF